MFHFKKNAATQHIKKCNYCIAALHNYLMKNNYKQLLKPCKNEVINMIALLGD